MNMKELWEESVKFHGHSCPGLAYGVKASIIALEKLNINRSKDEELVAIVENDACGVDAVQVITGCSIGKGNLIIRNYGKQVFIFIKRGYDNALRIYIKPLPRNEEERELRKKVFERTATEEEKERFNKIRQERIEYLLNAKEEEVADIKWIDIEEPERARIFNSLQCEICGEFFMETKGRIQDGKIVCMECFRYKE